MTSRIRIAIPQRSHYGLAQTEKAFRRAIDKVNRCLVEYDRAYRMYRMAAFALYDQYNMNIWSRPLARTPRGRNLALEGRVGDTTLAEKAFRVAIKRQNTTWNRLYEARDEYIALARTLCNQYQMPGGPIPEFINRQLENILKNKAARVIQSQARRKLTIKGLSTFARGMNTRNFPQTLTEKIMRTSLNRQP
jgi:hypothetical protein